MKITITPEEKDNIQDIVTTAINLARITNTQVFISGFNGIDRYVTKNDTIEAVHDGIMYELQRLRCVGNIWKELNETMSSKPWIKDFGKPEKKE